MYALLTKYWLEKQFEINHYNNIIGGNKKKWNTLEHNGVMFPPEYQKHNIPIIYKNEKIILDKDNEEIATLYAKYLETEYVKNKIFNKNFWEDWKKILGNEYKIQSLNDCDFKLINEYIIKQKQDKISSENLLDANKFKIAIVDGKEQPVGNFRIEPPGIFIGRGCNPKLGKIKKRIQPEDIIINIGKNSKIPEPPKGHKWKKVIHDNTVEWLASWKDNITGKIKYVWLGAHSDLKAKSDINKFDLARKLKKKIKTIRDINNSNLSHTSIKIKQIATAIYFMDKYALRVGNEKSEDDTDTVGVTSLRVEHIQLLDNNNVKLDFLSKDSVRYNRLLSVEQQIYSNLYDFIKGKSNSDLLFDKITSNDVNKYLQELMKGLSAKVFRTFSASSLFQNELNKITKKYDQTTTINILLDEFNRANAKVALLCNHQKNINKNTNNQIKKIDDMIKKIRLQIKKTNNNNKKIKLRDNIKKLKIKKELRIELKNVSLGTSKINYIDPRITVSFLKKYNIPIEKVFSATLREKFKWAFDVDIDFVF